MEQQDKIAIESFKVKKLLKRIQNCKPTGSVVTLIIPPKKKISDYTKMLNQEIGKTSNVKDKGNAQRARDAQIYARQRLKLYKAIPKNGLCIFTGHVIQEDGKSENKLMIDFQPYRPITSSLYDCSFSFSLQKLRQELNANDPLYGFIIVDGNGTLYATLRGSSKQIIQKFTVELPKKHRRGGQSSVRFARLRVQKRLAYLKKVCDYAINCFIKDDKITVTGIILAGSADFKNQLQDTQHLDMRLKAKILGTLDICYGGQFGLNQAIELSKDLIQGVKFMKEKSIIKGFFKQIVDDTGMFIYGVKDTMKVFEAGAIQRIILFQGLQHFRLKLRNPFTDQQTYQILLPKQMQNVKGNTLMMDQIEFKVEEVQLLTDWLALNYKQFSSQLIFVSDKSQQGTQFAKGFGGIAGILRYKFQLQPLINQQYTNQQQQDDDDFI